MTPVERLTAFARSRFEWIGVVIAAVSVVFGELIRVTSSDRIARARA